LKASHTSANALAAAPSPLFPFRHALRWRILYTAALSTFGFFSLQKEKLRC
jgi:hypothetical protein